LGNAEDRKTLKEVISKSDIITLHVPDLPSTKNMINKTNLKYFKKGSILINYARGEVVDLVALRKYLQEGHFGFRIIKDNFHAKRFCEYAYL